MLGPARAETLSYSAVRSFPKNSNLRYHAYLNGRTTYCRITALCVASRGNKNSSALKGMAACPPPVKYATVYQDVVFLMQACLSESVRWRWWLFHWSATLPSVDHWVRAAGRRSHTPTVCSVRSGSARSLWWFQSRSTRDTDCSSAALINASRYISYSIQFSGGLVE